MNKTQGKTYWFDLPVSDLERAEHFYRTLLAWKFLRLSLPNLPDYRMIEVDGELIGGLRKVEPGIQQGEAPVLYFCVDQLEEKTRQAQELGARLSGLRVDLAASRGSFQGIIDLDDNIIALWAFE